MWFHTYSSAQECAGCLLISEKDSTLSYDSLVIGTAKEDYGVIHLNDELTVKTSDSIFKGRLIQILDQSIIVQEKWSQHRVAFSDIELIKLKTKNKSKLYASYALGGIGGFIAGFGIGIFPSAMEYESEGAAIGIIGIGSGIVALGHSLTKTKYHMTRDAVIIPPKNM